jgi:hypothetical protein
MSTSLSDEQRQALGEAGPPIEVRDGKTDEVFYLISAEEYQEVRQILKDAERVDPSYFEFTDFTPTGPVNLPEHSEMVFKPRLAAPKNGDEALDRVYAILSERYASGETDVAARHDEPTPD